MNQYENINNNNYQEKIFYNNNNEIIEEINQSDTNNYSQLEQDIRILINFLRTNPIDFCNNLIQKNKYRQNQDQIAIINFIEDITRKQTLSEYIEIPELSSAARYLLDSISHHYTKFQNLNLKELDPKSLNLRYRLSNYGERTGRIFETVLFKMDNPEDIVNYILREEKGRNMLLNYKMKYIGIACDMLPSNFMCTVIDIVQDFIPYREKQNLNNINNTINKNNDNNSNTINSNLNKNNIPNMQNNKYSNNTYTNSNSGNIKNKYFYNQSNSEYMSLINNLNNKNSKENLKLKINMPENKSKEIEMNIDNKKDNNIIENNEIINQNINKQKNIYYKTPIKLPQKIEDEIFSPKSENPNEINIKKILPKRNNSNNINILKKENNIYEDIENIKDIKFTMAGRTYKQQQEIIEKSNKKNLNKSKSVCSLDIISNCSKTSNKNKFQRLNHEEKMEILHKINHRNNKTPNSQSVSDKNSENANNINSNKNINNDYMQKNSNFEINFDNKSRKSPSRSTYNQDYYDILSDTDKNNVNNLNKYMNKNYKNNNYEDASNQTFTDLRSNQGLGNNDEYSKNKINEIKNDLIYFKNQIKKELKDEVREEIKNELNKKFPYENKQKNKPIIIHLERDYNMQNNNIYNNYDEREKRNPFDENNEINDKIYYKQNNINNYINKNRDQNRCSSVEKYFYIKNNNNNINNINNTNIILPDNEIQYNQYTQNNFHKGRKSFNLNEFINNNNNINDNNREQIKEKYQQLKYTPIINNQDNISNYSKGSYQNPQYIINKDNSIKKDINESFFNEGYKRNNRQEIKKLIKLYNIAKEDKRNKSLVENNNKPYNIINNNKSISNYNFNPNNQDDNIKIDINEDINNKNKININQNYIGNNNNINNNNNLEKLKNDFRNNYNLYDNNTNNEEENNVENDFVKGHRFQIKYEKVKPKGQVYNKTTIPKPRNSSVKKTHNYLNYNNVNNDSKSYLNEYPFNKNEDIVNLENTHLSNEKEEVNNKTYNNIEKDYIIEKKSYLKKFDEVKTYTNAEGKNENNINDKNDISSNNNLNSIDKLSITAKFIDDNNINNNNLESNNNLKSNDTVDIKNYMDKNITYKESKDKPIISKREKMDGSNIITTITTKTREIYTPNKPGKEDEYIINKKVHKKQSDLIKEYKKYEKLENMNGINDVKSNNGADIYNTKIITKKLNMGRKTYDRVRLNKNNKNNFIEIENDTLKTPNQFKKGYRHYENEYYNNTNISPRFNNNFNNKTNSYFKNKKYTPYPYYPYEYTVNYINDNNLLPSRRLNYNNNGSLEKKYIKDPEGNLIETYVKKTKYNDGSVLLEYI